MHIYDKQCEIMQKNQIRLSVFTRGRQELCVENAKNYKN